MSTRDARPGGEPSAEHPSSTTNARGSLPEAARPNSQPAAECDLPQLSDAKPRDYAGLHNVVAYAAGFYSGSAPEGDAGFESLRRMGIRTIISVDGAQPDLARAGSIGLRYVHLPIGYDGMKRERTLEIARAVKELPGPIYLHCHHGKHRSAGAAGAAVVTLGMMAPSTALERMAVSGTSPSYQGLFRCVETAVVASDAELRNANNEFPQSWKTGGLVRTMVEIDLVFDRLKLIERAGWNVPVEHSDLVPAAEAGLLADLFRNLNDNEQCRVRPAAFLEEMAKSSRDAQALEDILIRPGLDAKAASALMARLTQQCRDCHALYRD